MATLAQTKLYNFLFKIALILLAVVFFMNLIPRLSTSAATVLENLTPPTLPKLEVVDSDGNWIPQYWTEQNWGGTYDKPAKDTRKYHHISQGTRTFVIPYSWFVHLEEADSSLTSFLFKSLFFLKSNSFSADKSMLRFGFIRSEKDPVNNPDGLPIGFSKAPYMKLEGLPRESEGLGLTCAACHTGHFVYSDGDTKREYIIEGAPATMDLYRFQDSITAVLSQTAFSSLIPFFDGRFDRLARRVLGTEYSAARKLKMREELFQIINAEQQTTNIIEAALATVTLADVTQGFSRTDALNGIGNQVFSVLWPDQQNYHALNAPVNYPFLWTTSWFDWIQYDGSIMSPLMRNVGEAMGVDTPVVMTASKDEFRFNSAVPVKNMVWIEDFLSGPQPSQELGFTGLLAPSWQKTFKQFPIDQAKANKGKQLYKDQCQRCHLPALDDPAIWQDKYFSSISYYEKGQQEQSADKVLRLKINPLNEIGTDPAQASVLAQRTVNTAGNATGTVNQMRPGMGLETTICGQNPNQLLRNSIEGSNDPVDLVDVKVKDGGELNFGLALGAFVQQSIDAWFSESSITDAQQIEKMKGGRPNCIQAGNGYKARPLNGVWATAPFLHNGSVANLRDLLCPTNGIRPTYVRLGGIGFDPKNVGLSQPENFQEEAKKYTSRNQVYTNEGYFIVDTTLDGNRNTGHEYSDDYDQSNPPEKQKKGIIGPKFTTEQCDAMIEYLKTI